MASSEPKKDKNLEANLVIIGGGGAGLAAAVAAAEKGAGNIIVLEKRGLGGNTALAGGPFGAESPTQKRAAIDISRDDIFKKAMNHAHWQNNPRIVRAFIDKSGDTIRWLEEKGINFELVPLYYSQAPLVWHVPTGRPLALAVRIIKVLTGDCERLGVQLFTRTRVKKIMTGSKGEVAGVLAETKGEKLAITTKSVIIASGGYGGNRELLRKYYPYYDDDMKYIGVPQNTGDGLLMATEIGAATEGLGLLLGGGGPGGGPAAPPMKINLPSGKIEIHLQALLSSPYMICVNKKGERFFDETMRDYHISICSRANRGAYTLFDHKMVQHMAEQGVCAGFHKYREQQRDKLPGLEKELERKAGEGYLKISDSWDEIADYISVDPKVLKTTIDEYNAACDQGHDPFLAKDRKWLWPLRTPPYYACGGTGSGFLDTLGGIKINEHMEVLDKQDNPIAGLYAAGVVAGGWQAGDYCGYHMSGAAVGFALNSGRIAGENASEYMRSVAK